MNAVVIGAAKPGYAEAITRKLIKMVSRLSERMILSLRKMRRNYLKSFLQKN